MPVHDPRIPVRLGVLADLVIGDALLVEGDGPVPVGPPVARFATAGPFGHAPGCPCCGAHDPVSLALQGLFVARMRGTSRFASVLAVVRSGAGASLVRTALAGDLLAATRFRLEE